MQAKRTWIAHDGGKFYRYEVRKHPVSETIMIGRVEL